MTRLIRPTIRHVLRVYGAQWWRLVLVQLLDGAAVAAIVYVLFQLTALALAALRPELAPSGQLNLTGAVLVALGVVLLFALTGVPIMFSAVVATITITDDALAGRRPVLLRSLLLGILLSFRMLGVVLLGFGVTAALLVLSPAISVLGVLGLLATPVVRRVRRRRPGFAPHWPSVMALVWWAIPGALALRRLAQALLAIPAAVLESAGPVAAWRAAGSAVRSHRLLTLLSVLVAVIVGLLVNAAFALLGSLAGDVGRLLLSSVAQLGALGIPIVTLAVVYRGIAEEHGHALTPEPLPGARTAPRLAARPWPAWIRRTAMTMPGVLLIAGLAIAPATSASATPGAAVTFTVTSSADDVDPTTLATEQQNCVTATGACTLRAALTEAGAEASAGTASSVTIGFASDTTIHVDPSGPLVFAMVGGEGGGEGGSAGTLTIDGHGHAVTLDGQGATQDLVLNSPRWSFALQGLELRGGNAHGAWGTSGGGLFLNAPRTSTIDDVTFDHNSAMAGAGIYAVANVAITDSTFSDNNLVAVDSETVGGGADIFGGRTTNVLNSTFARPTGGSIVVWGSQGGILELDNSLIAATTASAEGGFDCVSLGGGSMSGAGNVTADGTSCPGIVATSDSRDIGELARVDAAHPPVVPLIPIIANAAIGATTAGCSPTDARGAIRPAVGCDAGAYQFDPATAVTIQSSSNPSSFGDLITLTAHVAAAHDPSSVTSGTVQFLVDGAATGAPSAVDGRGEATLALSGLEVGSHSVTASFDPGSGQVFAAGGTGSALTQIVAPAGTEVLLSADHSSVALGDDVTLSIGVGDATRSITGTVSVNDVTDGAPGVVIASNVAIGANNVATVVTNSLVAGPRILVAHYSGDAGNAAGASSPLTVDVLASATTTLTTGRTAAPYGSPVTLTAHVAGAHGAATGQVLFTQSGQPIGTVALDAQGDAVLAASTLPVGTDPVVAHYRGDTLYAQDDSAVVDVEVSAATTSTSIVSDAGAGVDYGAPVTLVATVADTAAGSTADPTGSVVFTLDGSPLATVAVTPHHDGTATASYTTAVGDLPVGNDNLGAQFTNTDGSFETSTAAATPVVVAGAPTTTTLVSDGSPAPAGHLTQLTATVVAIGGSLAVPTGTVTFHDGSVVLGTATLSGGVATLGVGTLARGSHSLTADYAGTSRFAASSGAFTQVVSTTSTTTTVSPSTGTPVFGQAVAIDIAVTADGGPAPDGTVQISDGATFLAQVAVTGGVGMLPGETLSIGAHHLSAVFVGNDDYLTSTGTTDVTVAAAPTATTVDTSRAHTSYGESVTITGTVRGTDAASGLTPTGSITFFEEGNAIATVPLVDNGDGTASATFTTTALPQSGGWTAGLPIYAGYVPDTGFTASIDQTGRVVVDPVGTSVALTVSPATTTDAVTATATVTTAIGSATPTGSIVFSDDGGPLGVVQLVGGVASLSALHFALGTKTIVATYFTTDSDFVAGGEAQTTFTIGQGGPDVVLSDSATGTITYGASDTLTAFVGANSIAAAPVGTITFSAVGPQGTTVLGTVTLSPATSPLYAVAASAQLATTLPVGTQQITATYSGDADFAASTSSPLSRLVIVATTTTTVAAGQEPGWVGAPIDYVVDVRSASGALPAGTVTVTSDGLTLDTVPVTFGRAVVHSTFAPIATASIVASFTPTDDGFGPSSASLQHSTTLIPTTISVTAGSSVAGIGQSVMLTAIVTPANGYTIATSQAPSGVVLLSDGNGEQCSAPLGSSADPLGRSTASCSLSWTHIGTQQIGASFEGSLGLYAPSTSTSSATVRVLRSAPSVTFTSSTGTDPWVGGETSTLTWDVEGPITDDGLVTVKTGSTTICTSQTRVGSCDYAFPARQNGVATLTLSYAGDADWTAATKTLTPRVTACVPAGPIISVPSDGGTGVSPNRPDCDDGTGYRAGDTINFFASPAHGFTISTWALGTITGSNASYVVSPTMPSVGNTVYFNAECVTVTLTPSTAAAFISTTPQEPNCGDLPREWRTESNGRTETGSFTPGTTMTLHASEPTVPPGATPVTFYEWLGLGASTTSATTSILLHTGTDVDATARYGVVCYHDIHAVSGVAIGATNCTDPSGPGYIPGSTVAVSTKTTGGGYFSNWTGGGTLTGVTSTVSGSSATLLIDHDHLTVGASYGRCVHGTTGVNGEGTVTITPTGNCPSQGAGWYTAGTVVHLVATPTLGRTFSGWSGLPTDGSFNDTYAHVNDDGTFTGTFYYQMHCVPLHFVSVPAGAVSISAVFPANPNGTCPAGQYDESIGDGAADSNNAILTATPVSAAAKNASIGFSVTSKRLNAKSLTDPYNLGGIAGSSLTVGIYGETTITATVCEALDAKLTLVSPNGTAHTSAVPDNTDFIDVAPTPTCPYGTSSYIVGDKPIFPQANGPADGYTFTGWSGALTSSDPLPTTGFVLDGSARSKTLTATYGVTCHTLTSNWANVNVAPAPNCPDTAPSAHSYIGGTTVTLQAAGDGSLLFRGWTGKPDTTSDDIAIALMKSDQSVYADYTAETTGEKIVKGITSVGDALAITAKKVTGVVAAVGSALLLGANPVTAIAGIVVGLGTLVTMGLTALGVSGSGLDAVTNTISDISSMMTFITATLNCATVWSYTADGGTPSSTVAGVGNATSSAISKEITVQQEARAAAQQAAINEAYGIETTVSATSAKIASAKVAAGRLGSAAAVGAAIYTEVASGGAGWDSSATSAWTTGGDLYSRCVGQSIPSYFGLPPVPSAG